MHKLLYTARTWLLKGACNLVRPFARFDPTENLLVFSDPRGGSTWLAEMLMTVPRTVLLWEPLNVANVSFFDDLNFSLRQYVPPDADWEEARQRFERLFRGDLIDHWTCQDPIGLARAERMVVKVCRGNALLPWMSATFDLAYEPVYLVRHPFAVVASQLRYGAWEDYEGFEVPKGPFDSYYREHEAYVQSLETVYEGLVAQWCLTNLVPLRSPRNDVDWITVYYEDLLADSDAQIRRIFDRWRMEPPPGIFAAAGRASSTTRRATFNDDVNRQLSKWMAYFDDEAVDRMMAVLDHFGVSEYGRDVRPLQGTTGSTSGAAASSCGDERACRNE
ncbi:MAG: hypothetical protein WD021_08925 [Rhodothermales bacterium]